MSKPEEQQAATPSIRVLIADDVEETRRSAELMMRLVPDTQVVATARNGREAVQMAQQHRPHIALIDVNMPEMDGLSAIHAIRKSLPDTVCIVISAEQDAPTLKRAIAVGIEGYLIKPFTAEQLFSVVQRACQMVLARQKPPEPPAMSRQEHIAQLEALAETYARTHRADDKAMAVFEELARQPDCKLRWLMTLAIVYVVRREWKKLRALAGYLERRTPE